MADKPTSNLNVHAPPPSTTPASVSNAPFTPRSSTFPDDLDSDSEDVFEPTPVHSPSGPHYDDLPPSYDEAQQQALHDARNGVPPLNPENLEMHRLALNEGYSVPQGAEVHAHRATAAEIEQENRRNASGLGMNVPVQQLGASEQIPVGVVRSGNTTSTLPLDPTSVLLSTALEFTKHEPDADSRYAPRLTRCVAIPQVSVPSSERAARRGRECGRRGVRRTGRGGGRRGDRQMSMPGQWPESSSVETLPTETEEPVQFFRAYAKALHAHSIRPAEFLDFLDGLNALCAAMGTTPADLVNAEENGNPDVDVVRNYINATNEAFFAPRGLRVSLRSLSTLMDAIKIPEERGQRAGAVVSVLDNKSTPDRRAQALHPWIEALETNVPAPSIAALVLKDMAQRFGGPPQMQGQTTANEGPNPAEAEKRAAEAQDSDPPHSLPPEPQPAQAGPGWPPLGGWRGHGSWNRGRQHGRGWGPFGPPGWGPFGPPGFGPHGPPGFGPHGPPGFGPHGPPGHGPWGGPGRGPWGAHRGGWGGHGCGVGAGVGAGAGAGARGPGGEQPQNPWEEWGKSIGKWGEEFGKKMEVWGEQFGKRAEAWGDGVASRGSGSGPPGEQAGAAGPNSVELHGLQAESSANGLAGQETGVLRDNGAEEAKSKNERKAKEKAGKKASKDDDDDDDASSISSDSSSNSDSDSDSEDEEKYPDTDAIFLQRVREINTAAESSLSKGKKTSQEIERERSLAIEKACRDKDALEVKVKEKRMKRAVWREFRDKKRAAKKEHREKKRAMRRTGVGKKSKEWKELKKGYRERKREGQGKGMVWVVVENLD
ncbi:hypothetical protein BU26DRAFT_49249 [Trematosphaeria pertusa]|uniref:Uncharacterized protein n=1 Tax=Trematosphaeria pertusa TaxID=390896 RepID=A0A6A6IAP5_9PLEO|nr:uncharacterized protein BU26DRAFT_49249 [Trematosphaeria pertusa]KAF2246563.1 hypothetical protein BU26DRAFT_49249 [Trematosphaeria pertusa]